MSDMATRSYHTRNVQSIGYGAVDGVAKMGFRASAIFGLVYSCDAGRRQNATFICQSPWDKNKDLRNLYR
jgi:hypothetical protein